MICERRHCARWRWTGVEVYYKDRRKRIYLERPLYNSKIPIHRKSYDSVVNKSWREVLQICKGLSLYIVNGRTRGDSLGRFTYSSVLGDSVPDCSITDIPSEHINAFTCFVRSHFTLKKLKKIYEVNQNKITNQEPYAFNHPYLYIYK